MNLNNWFSHTFHSSVTVTGDGVALDVDGYKTLVVEIDSDVTSHTIEFKGKLDSSSYKAISGVNTSTLSAATTTTGKTEMWQFDVVGLKYVIMDITALTAGGGTTTITGKVVT